MNHHDLVAPVEELRQHVPARCIDGGVADDHDGQTAVGAVVEPGEDHGKSQGPHEIAAEALPRRSQRSAQVDARVPREHRACGPESIEATLQPGKCETAPAHLLEKTDDDQRRQEGAASSAQVCVRAAPLRHRRPVATASAAATAAITRDRAARSRTRSDAVASG